MYRHTQHSHGTRLAALAAGVAALCGLLLTGAPRVAWVALAVVPLIGLGFGSLTTEVTPDRFAFWFGPGVVRRSFPLSEIAACQAVTNPWWYGWGIHLTPYGWLYNLGGRGAVQLMLRDGRTLRVGTDEPARLCEAIREGRGAA